MSPDHQTSERVYHGRKADVLSGALGGGRLNLASLEQRYSSSATPVREALLRLVGEGLVDLLHRGGFGVCEIDARGLRELYELNLRVLALVTSWRPRRELSVPGRAEMSSPLDPPVDSLFNALAESANSDAYVALVGTLNDRLHRIRLSEARVMSDAAEEFESISTLARMGRDAVLRRALTAYHRRRVRMISEIIHALSRTNP